jgi:hypothetical protein
MMKRGQAHTLEAVVAALLLLSSLIFALQMTAVTPLSASTSSKHIENQLEASGRGILATASEQDALKPAILAYNDQRGKFYNTGSSGAYTTNPPDNRFGKMLNRSFTRRGITYNVLLAFEKPGGGLEEVLYINRGTPTDNAVQATRTVVLSDETHLRNADGTRNRTRLAETTDYPIRNVDQDSPLYNTVRVEVIIWRI